MDTKVTKIKEFRRRAFQKALFFSIFVRDSIAIDARNADMV